VGVNLERSYRRSGTTTCRQSPESQTATIFALQTGHNSDVETSCTPPYALDTFHPHAFRLLTITERPVLGAFRFFDTFTFLAFVIRDLLIALELDATLDPACVGAFLDTAEEVACFSFAAGRSVGGRDDCDMAT
jgi:hypothetical protein